MKIIPSQKHKAESNQISFEYSLWPSDGTATLTATPWENGEGIDIDMDGTKIELTYQEWLALAKGYLMTHEL